MRLKSALFTVLGALALGAAVGGECIFRIACARNKEKKPVYAQGIGEKFVDQSKREVDWLLRQPLEKVSLYSEDGLCLRGYRWRVEHPQRCILLVHGYHGNCLSNFAGYARFLHENGCEVFLIDMRASGTSEGKWITFGLQERKDCITWAKHIHDLYNGTLPIYLDGLSMGAATVLMASELSLPVSVRGIIADSGYSSPGQIIRWVMKSRFHLPAVPFFWLFRLSFWLHTKIDIESASALQAVKKTTVPVLMVHGEADSYVPCSMGRAIFSNCAAPCKKLVTFPEVEHGESYLDFPIQCKREILNFFASNE